MPLQGLGVLRRLSSTRTRHLALSICPRPTLAAPRPAAVEKADTGDADDDALQGEYTWYIENFSKNKQAKLYSPVFQSGQYNWCARLRKQIATTWILQKCSLRLRLEPLPRPNRRILLFPGGNNVQQLSVYLDVADSATLPQGWTRHAHFTLTVHNQKDPMRNVVKGA
jgi:ubiquitin carboxyl-terminal hydrolase 7